MTAEVITEYCLSKRGAVQDYPFGPDPTVFKVGGKIFATIYRKGRTRFGMKCDPILADLLRGQYSSITLMYKSPHWIYILDDGGVPDDEILYQIDHSYDLIVKSLTKKARERLNLL
jgi:predicted DNA-binding protein (MmcQ/YjbR family)